MTPSPPTLLAYDPAVSAAVLRKVVWRLIPLIVFLYVLAYLDRINLGFATLQMSDDLKLSDRQFGFGAGIFYFGYLLFEVPSNLILARVGASRWIARIMISWGVIASAMMFVKGPASFFTLRFLLGFAEAGFFPGMLLYLTWWFPPAYRARTVALFFTATAITGVIGGPISGACLAMDGIAGLRGWQWLFLLEGIPSILFGFVVIFALTDKPDHATWLSVNERNIVREELARSNAESAAHHGTLREALRDPRLWLLSAIYLFLTFGLYSFGYWMPKLIKSVSKFSDARVAIVSAIPYGIAAVAMIIVGRRSDRKNEQRWHAALAALIAACGFAGATYCENTATLLTALSVAAIGIWCAVPPFWSIPSLFLRDRAAAGGIAAINSIGNLGGFFGPFLFGWIKQRSGASYTWALLVTAASMMVCGMLVLALPKAHPAAQRPA